ncbi:MAG TPA: type II secretion system F family protein [Acidobacteriota bacterium]|nr:type II secretion system F family protein [Acidobacteriota bacterium]
MLVLITVLIFLVVLGLALSGIYFLIEAPAEKKRLQIRLAAIQQASHGVHQVETDLLRAEVLSGIPFLNRLLIDFAPVKFLTRFLDQADARISAGTFLLLSLAMGLGMMIPGILLQLPIYLSGVLVLMGAAIPTVIVSIRRARRLRKFLEQLPDALDLLARAVRAGHAFTTGLELIATEMPEPVAGEFRITYDQQNLGLPLRDALQNLCVRVPLQDVRIFVTALQIQRESGGNLAEILGNLSYVIRERFKLQRQIQVYTAESRVSLYILTIVPPILAVVFVLANPEYIRPLFEDPMGQKMVMGAIILQIIGYLVIRRVTRMKV